MVSYYKYFILFFCNESLGEIWVLLLSSLVLVLWQQLHKNREKQWHVSDEKSPTDPRRVNEFVQLGSIRTKFTSSNTCFKISIIRIKSVKVKSSK